jgi:uncharacterized protein YjbJ (UPF0337 family)
VSDKVDELTGKVKEGAGRITGNEQQEAEGKAQADVARLRQQVDETADQIGKGVDDAARRTQGAIDDAAGKAQEAWGRATDDPGDVVAGKARQVEGQVRQP